MFSTEKKADLQFAMEAAKFEPLTFEDNLDAIQLQMFQLGSKANFLRHYADCFLI